MPGIWRNCSSIEKLAILRALRPDRMVPSILAFVHDDTLQLGVDQTFESEVMKKISTAELLSPSPILQPTMLVVSPGTDPTSELVAAAKATHRQVFTASLGHGQLEYVRQGLKHFDMDSNGLVILQNIHLAPKQLTLLTRQIITFASSRRNVRLFLTTELNHEAIKNIPAELIQATFKVVLESPHNIGHNFDAALKAISREEWTACESQPVAFHRLGIALCYFHAVATSRREYGPRGWNMKYPFSLNDLSIALTCTRRILDQGNGLDLEAIRYMVGNIIYGGHIVDFRDRHLCRTYMDQLITEALLMNDHDALLVPASEQFSFEGLQVPHISNVETYIAAAQDEIGKNLQNFTPLMIGMLPESTAVAAVEQSLHAVSIAGVMMQADSDVDPTPQEGKGTDIYSGHGSISSKTSSMIELAIDNLPQIPPSLTDSRILDLASSIAQRMRGNSDKPEIAYEAIYHRERQKLVAGIASIEKDMQSIDAVMNGEIVEQAYIRELINSVRNDTIPLAWIKLFFADTSLLDPNQSLSQWLARLAAIVAFQIEWTKIIHGGECVPHVIDLRCLFHPRSLFATVRIVCAAAHDKGFESFSLRTEVTSRQPSTVSRSASGGGLFVCGLMLEGATWSAPVMVPAAPGMYATPLPVLHIFATDTKKDSETVFYSCPMYATELRGDSFLCYIDFPCGKATITRRQMWTMEGVAAIFQPL